MTQSQTEMPYVQQSNVDPLADKVIVDREALRAVLSALNGPGHLIRELQATRTLPPMKLGDDSVYENPINKLIEDFNKHVASVTKTTTDQTKPE